MLRAIGRFALLAATLCILVPAPTARAFNQYEANWFYYDECYHLIGERFTSCNGHVFYQDGQQSGAYKEVELVPCEDGEIERYWYQWNGTQWVNIAGPPAQC